MYIMTFEVQTAASTNNISARFATVEFFKAHKTNSLAGKKKQFSQLHLVNEMYLHLLRRINFENMIKLQLALNGNCIFSIC